MRARFAGLAVLLLASAVRAQIVDDFEHGNKFLYVPVGGPPDNLVLDGQAAHDGLLGAHFISGSTPWLVRADATTSPGNTYTCFIQSTGALGRTYIGVSASAAGTWSMVAASNTSELLLQENAGFGFNDIAATPFSYQPNLWYQIELEWTENGDMTVRLWDEQHVNLLAETPTVLAVTTTPGGLALRGFDVGDAYVDTVSAGKTHITTYCTAKQNSLGCLPAISGAGAPRASASSDFVVSAAPVYNQKPGVLMYSVTGRQAVPFQGGILCVAPPIRRTIVMHSGGDHPVNKNCSGVWRIDMNAFAAGAIGGKPDPLLKVAGTFVHCQWWGRDPGFAPPNNTALSDGLQYAIGP